MIATIAVIAAIAEKKKSSAIAAIIAITWKPLSSDRWDRKSSISAIVVAAIAERSFLSDRSDQYGNQA